MYKDLTVCTYRYTSASSHHKRTHTQPGLLEIEFPRSWFVSTLAVRCAAAELAYIHIYVLYKHAENGPKP